MKKTGCGESYVHKELIVDAELAGSELRHLHEQHHHDSLKSHNHEAVSPSPETVGLSIDI
jgi:hypothetical protein